MKKWFTHLAFFKFLVRVKKIFSLTRLERYLFVEIFKGTLVALALFTIINLISFVQQFTNLAIENKVPLYRVFKLIFFILPNIISFILPASIFLGVILSLSILSHYNEILAFRTCRFPLFKFYKVVSIFSFLALLFHTYLFESLLPLANTNFIIEKFQIVKQNPILELSRRGSFRDQNQEIFIQSTKKNEIFDIQILNFRQNQLILSPKGVMLDRLASKQVYPLELRDVMVVPYLAKKINDDKMNYQSFYSLATIQIKDFSIRDMIPTGTDIASFSQLLNLIEKERIIRSINAILKYNEFITYSAEKMQLMEKLRQLRDPKEKQKLSESIEDFSHDIQNIKVSFDNANARQEPIHEWYQFYRRLSFVISCLFMGLLAIPFGITLQRRGKEMAIGGGILILVSYNGLLVLSNFTLDNRILSPFMAAFLPTFILGLTVASLIAYRTFKKKEWH